MKKSFAFGMAVMALLAIGSVASAAPMPAGTLLHYWDCEDAGTGTLADTANIYYQGAAVTEAPLTTPAPVVTTTGVVGAAALVPRYSNALSSLYDLGGTFTVEFWLRVDSLGTNGWNIVMNNWGGTLGLHMGGTAYGASTGNVTYINPAGYTQPTIGTWMYTAMVADAAAGTFTAYGKRDIDADLQVIGTATNYNGISADPTNPFMLGANAGRAKYGGTNAFDEVAIWNVALSEATVLDHYLNGLQLTTGNPDPTFHPGDANGDGGVDLQDFGLLKENFGIEIGGGALWAQGDFNADGGIDLQDFGILKDHFGHTTGDVPVTAVPEPATMTLLALAGLGLIRRKR